MSHFIYQLGNENLYFNLYSMIEQTYVTDT